MKLEDRKLIQIKEVGDEFTNFISPSGLSVAVGYNRIVFGARGPYIEFDPTHIVHSNIHIPENQLFRLTDPRIYYIEFRSCDVNLVKIYYQMRTVAYADYKIGMFYISPLELQLVGGESVLKMNTENEKSREFFE
jgi:hypothetical protein